MKYKSHLSEHQYWQDSLKRRHRTPDVSVYVWNGYQANTTPNQGPRIIVSISLGSHVLDFRLRFATVIFNFCALVYAIFTCNFRVKSAILYFILKLEWVVYWKVVSACDFFVIGMQKIAIANHSRKLQSQIAHMRVFPLKY